MGMDVFGKNPKSKRGEYFRNNVWWWRPLAIYCVDNHPEIAEKCEDWHTNSGDGLGAKDSKNLAKALLADIESGRAEEWQKAYYKNLSELPRQDCEICGATGIRNDERGREWGHPDKALSPEVASLVGRESGWCNGCDGIGTREAWAAQYPFSVENLNDFADFLMDCGGFQIC